MATKNKISKVQRLRDKENKTFATKVSWIIIGLGLTIGLVVAANKWLDNEHIQGLRVGGVNYLDTNEIVKLAGVDRSIPVQKLNLDSIENNVLRHPFIAQAEVYRGEKGNLKIDISERIPVARVIVSDSIMYADSSGKLLAYHSGFMKVDVPVISGVMRGTKVDKNKLWQAIGVIKTIQDSLPEINSLISEVQFATNQEIILFLTDNSVPVLIGNDIEKLPARLRKFRVFAENILSQKGGNNADLIDLRWHDKVVVRWKDDRAELAPNITTSADSTLLNQNGMAKNISKNTNDKNASDKSVLDKNVFDKNVFDKGITNKNITDKSKKQVETPINSTKANAEKSIRDKGKQNDIKSGVQIPRLLSDDDKNIKEKPLQLNKESKVTGKNKVNNPSNSAAYKAIDKNIKSKNTEKSSISKEVKSSKEKQTNADKKTNIKPEKVQPKEEKKKDEKKNEEKKKESVSITSIPRPKKGNALVIIGKGKQ